MYTTCLQTNKIWRKKPAWSYDSSSLRRYLCVILEQIIPNDTNLNLQRCFEKEIMKKKREKEWKREREREQVWKKERDKEREREKKN